MEHNLMSTLRECCLKSISNYLPRNTCFIGQKLLPYLLPEDLLEIIDRVTTLHGGNVTVCPFELLLPTPSVLLHSPTLRNKMHIICNRSSRATASSNARDLVLSGIQENDSAQVGLSGLMDLGAFLCETGWYEEGTDILERIFNMIKGDTSPQHAIIVLDSAQRQLAVAVTTGRVEAARQLSRHVYRLVAGRQGGLAVAAHVALARYCILVEEWHEAVEALDAAVASRAGPLPVDVAAELARVTGQLVLALRRPSCLAELVKQAASLAYHHWGERHPQTIAAVQLMADYTISCGLLTAGLDLLTRLATTCKEIFGNTNPLTVRALLNVMLARRAVTTGHDPTAQLALKAADLDELRPADDSSWSLDKMLISCYWMDDEIQRYMHEPDRRRHARLARYIMERLTAAVTQCERLFGRHSLRLAAILTEQGRQYFSLALDGLLPEVEGDCNQLSEAALQRARQIHRQHPLSADHRNLLLTKVTLGCLFTHSSLRLLHEAERLFRSSLEVCYMTGRRQHLDLVEHSLRGLASIYTQYEDDQRATNTSQVLDSVVDQQRRLLLQRVPASAKLAAVLPARTWSDQQLVERVRCALRQLRRPPHVSSPADAACSGGSSPTAL